MDERWSLAPELRAYPFGAAAQWRAGHSGVGPPRLDMGQNANPGGADARYHSADLTPAQLAQITFLHRGLVEIISICRGIDSPSCAQYLGRDWPTAALRLAPGPRYHRPWFATHRFAAVR